MAKKKKTPTKKGKSPNAKNSGEKQTQSRPQQKRTPKPKPLTFLEQTDSLGKQIKTYKVQEVWPGGKGPTGDIQFFGMGGSAIAADLVNNYLHHIGLPHFLRIRKDFHRNTDGINTKPAVFSSYSGETAETLSQAYEYKGNVAAVITTGGELAKYAEQRKWGIIRLPQGYQPRAALGYSFSTLLSLVFAHPSLRNLAPQLSNELNITGRHIIDLHKRERFEVRAENIANKLFGKSIAVYSSDAISGINYRWRGQLQENSDNLAFGGFFPEVSHNHVNGFQNPKNLEDRLAVVILKWKSDPMGLVEKQNRFAQMLRDRGFAVAEISTDTQSIMAAMFEMIYLADRVSIKLAEKNGADPEKIEIIQSLKF